MSRKVYVVGVGMTKFEKPGGKDWDYPDMAREAGTNAIEDAGIEFMDIEQAAVGYCYGDSTAGERAFYELGHSGIPIYNVNNNCSTGSTALYMAKQFVEGGLADCVMALGLYQRFSTESLRTVSKVRHRRPGWWGISIAELTGPTLTADFSVTHAAPQPSTWIKK